MDLEFYLLSFKAEIMPAASAGETCDGDCGLSESLCELEWLEEVLPGVAGREELTDGGYHDCVVTSCGGRTCSS